MRRAQHDTLDPTRTFLRRKLRESYREGTIVDVGCGKGRLSQFVAEMGIDVLGVDLDETEIERARRDYGGGRARFETIDVAELPGNEFAGVMMMEVLEHVHEPLPFLRQAHRICREGGFLILSIPNGFSAREIAMAGVLALKTRSETLKRLVTWYRHASGRDRWFNDSPHVQHFSQHGIHALLRSAGFEVTAQCHWDVWGNFMRTFFNFVTLPPAARDLEAQIEQHLPVQLLAHWVFFCEKR